MAFRTVNPASGEVLETFDATTPAELDARLGRMAAAQREFAAEPAARRGEKLVALAAALREAKASLATTMAIEIGKPLAQGEAEIEKCALTLEHYAAAAPALLEPTPRASDARRSYVRADPLGVVLAIMPWNFPFWQVVRFAAPALAAGNAGLVKPAPNAPRCALALDAAAKRAGLHDLLAPVFLDDGAAGDVIGDPRIAAVTLTGSERAGRAVGERAGRALKKCVLELGGSDAFLVLEDADLDAAARVAAQARLQNAGQSCIAAKRFVVVDAVYEAFAKRFVAEMEKAKSGNPLDRATTLGPLARRDLQETLAHQVQETLNLGATAALGGFLPGGHGAFYPPTVLAGVRPGMPVFDEETFGPVAALAHARDEADAVELANRSRYGLGATIFTANHARAERLAAALDVGMVFVNGMVKSDPRLPFGGVKASGHGRELAEFGLLEFVNAKTVWIA